jgi:putative membrane protein
MFKRSLAMSAALCLAVGCGEQSTESLGGSRSPTLSKMDNDYFRDIAESNMTEIQTSQMAENVSKNTAVLEFAQMMINDHTSAGSAVEACAGSKGAGLPKMLDDEHKELIKTLDGKTGADFDKAYMALQIKAQEMTINVDQAEADNGNDTDVKALAHSLLPTLKAHLSRAKKVQTALMGTGSM